MTVDWPRVNLVLLDMDGTLLDLHYDNYFWHQHLPKRYADLHGLTQAQAEAFLTARIEATRGQLHWYCIDAWADYLQLDLNTLKQETAHLIRLRPDTETFLQRLQQLHLPFVLATNAHRHSVNLKFAHSNLPRYFVDAASVVSAHDVGAAKESPEFWHALQQQLDFDPAQTLFIDDNLAVLNQAKAFGIGQVIAIANPDSQQPARLLPGFRNIHNFSELFNAQADV
jgi:putative hydrolase of the HAD superfamily